MPYFTKGTWVYAKEFDAVIVMRKNRFVPVADFGKIVQMEQDANGNLMAASKEMYTSLKACLDLIDKLMPGVRHIALQNYAELNEIPIAARRAITKAEGGK